MALLLRTELFRRCLHDDWTQMTDKGQSGRWETALRRMHACGWMARAFTCARHGYASHVGAEAPTTNPTYPTYLMGSARCLTRLGDARTTT
jgi:hypothetical protein